MRHAASLGTALDTSLDSLEGSTHAAFLQLKDAAEQAGLPFVVRSTRRTCAEQAGLYAIGRAPGDTRAVVTHARGCQSWHVSGRAVDVTMTSGSYAAFGALAKSMGWKWGGDFPGFPDVGHVEWHPGLTVEEVCPDPFSCSDADVDTSIRDDSGDGGSSPSPLPLLLLASAAVFTGIVWARS